MSYSHKRSRSDRQHHSSKRRRSRSPEEPKRISLYDVKNELNDYLSTNFLINNYDDFWKFYTKYENIQRKKPFNPDSLNLINIDIAEKPSKLFEKLPLYTKQGKKMPISKSDFTLLLNCIRTYQDFQLKIKFNKLRELRKAQADLPIAQFKEEIIQTVKDNKVVLIAGDTGCGKSTQVPQYILEAGYKKIAVTQPRRIACVSLANRVAYETLSTYKNKVGFQIRFEKTKNKLTNLIFLTEGILLRQINDADVFGSYECLILDEVHERHLNMDFLIGIMKCLLQHKNFKLILMSATINLELFENYFSSEGVKTIKVPGRLYPIDIVYKPIVKDAYDKKSSKFDCQPYINILELIDSKYTAIEKGDVLIFLNGINEISTLASAIQQYAEIKKNWIVLQLHSTLSLEEQDKVFHTPPENVRKCIISTNIAETSVTIDGIRFVIDSGKVNRMAYENCGLNRLFETNISQDSAKQRSGRAGRTGPGICYRLYSEKDLKSFDLFTPAEIHLVPLENLILNMITLGLTDIQAFPFLEKPSEESLRHSLERLAFLEALKYNENDELSLTSLGNTMSKLPVDLTISKMLIMSTIFGTVNSVLALASLISIQTPIIESKYFETKDRRSEYESNHGEPITLLNLYKAWLEVKKDTSYVKDKENSRSWSKKRGVEEQRFYEVTKLIEQFRDILQDAELVAKETKEHLSAAERSIRHGELQKLKKMRKDLKNETKDNRIKKLKMHMQTEDDADNSTADLRDVEFRITNDFRKIQQLLNDTNTDSYKDLTLLKLILTGALYPQVAIEDEHNSSKTVNERLYHTKVKQYVFLRPTSYFTTNPDFLELNDSDIDVPPNGYFSKRPLSRKHQILLFQKLLETKKTYLMNTFRMPAFQTLLLFAKKIATNKCLTKFIFDEFISIDAPFLWQGKVMLLKAIDLRKKLKISLENKLDGKNTDEATFYLIQELVDFMQSNVSYNIKRLLPADLKVIYTNEVEVLKHNPFDSDFVITPNKLGGCNVTENVIYNCLFPDSYDLDAETALVNENYQCDVCSVNFMTDIIGMISHERQCKKNKPKIDSQPNATIPAKANAREFFCDNCKSTLKLTPVDILRHKKSCALIKAEQK